MPLASMDLIRAREAAQRLLEYLELEAYLFEVEPGAGEWRLRVECATAEGWRTTTFPVDKNDLIASGADAEAFRRLRDEWNSHLGECRRQPA